MEQTELITDNFDYVIPVGKSCIKYSSQSSLLQILLDTQKYGQTIIFNKEITEDQFGQICSYINMGANNLDIYRMIERLDLMGTYNQLKKGVPLLEA